MPKSYFIYNGNDCQIWNCYKTQPINFPTPERDTRNEPVPGRNGDLIIDNGRYKNAEIIIDCYIESQNFIADFDAMRAELMRDSEYHELYDSIYPEEYRMARIVSVDAKTTTPGVGTVEIIIDAKPQRFSTTGGKYTFSKTIIPADIVAVGYADEIFSDKYYQVVGTPPHVEVVLLDISNYISAAHMAELVCYFSRDKIGNYWMEGDSSDDPRSSSFTGGATMWFFLNSDTYTFEFSGMINYVWFPTALLWELYDSTTNVKESALFEYAGEITNTTGYPALPLLKFHLGTPRATGQPVAMINGEIINMNVPSYIYIEGQPIAISDVYIDCDTMDAYALNGEAVLNLNKYVTLPPTIELGENTKIYLNGLVKYLEVAARWWSL